MKKKTQYMFLCLLLASLVWSCSKDEKKIYLEGGTAPVLSANKTELVLTDATKDEDAVTFSWTNPNYTFTTGVSSQDVTYYLEVDTAGANFTNPNKLTVSISNDMELTFTVGELNAYLSNTMLLKTGVSHNLEFRIKSTLRNNTAAFYSNVLSMTAIPFLPPPKVAPPTEGTLWLVGDAAAGGWNNPLSAPYDVTQKFTQDPNVSTLYTLTVDFIGGGGYKLVQKMGVWGTQYHALDGSILSGGDFEMKDSDPQFPGPATAGTYLVTVDFQLGKYYVVAQ
jgi:starch-binding outer membrane protein SusE/F